MLSAIKFSNTKNPKPGKPLSLRHVRPRGHGEHRPLHYLAEQFAQFGELVKPDSILVIRGRIDRRGDGEDAINNVIVDELIPLSDLAGRYTRGILLRVREDELGEDGLKQLYEILGGTPETASYNCYYVFRTVAASPAGVRSLA